MSTIYKHKGRWRIQFQINGRRCTLYAGTQKRAAMTLKAHVDTLIESQRYAIPIEPNTEIWLGKIDDEVHGKLSRIGLVRPRRIIGFFEYFDQYVANREVKTQTKQTYRLARQWFEKHFRAGISLNGIDRAGVLQLVERMVDADRSESYIKLTLRIGRQVFNQAMKDHLVQENPFAGVNAAGRAAVKQVYVSREDIEKLMAVAEPTLRKVLALSRFAGLRTPSEVCALRWEDIDWDKQMMLVTAQKTATTREIPLFERVAEVLGEYRQTSGPVITAGGANKSQYWGKRVRQLCRQLDVKQWPKVLNSLRGSFETDLAATVAEVGLPPTYTHNVLGHSPQVAVASYRKVTEDQHQRARLAVG